jgi:long-chain acyl-CoA synthetase
MNIIDPILFQCRVNGESPALCVPGLPNTVVSYAQLGTMIENATAALRVYDLSAGEVVAVYIADKILHLVLTLALIRLGLATVSCRARDIPKELNARVVFVDVPGPVTNAREVYVVDKRLLTAKNVVANSDWALPTADGNSICRLVLTSGSTGIAKAVPISHSKAIKRISRFNFGNRFLHSVRIFCDLGLSTSLGFLIPVFCLARGALVYFYGNDGLASLQALNLYKIQAMFTSAYNLNHYVDFLDQDTSFAVDLDHLVVGGSSASERLIERAWSRICPRIIGAYGATEAGVIASSDVRELRGISGAVGYVHPRAKVEIVDKNGVVLGPDIDGLIRIKTDEMSNEYYRDPVASALTFRDGWFYPGDVGSLSPNGLLVLSGRDEFILNIGGDKVRPDLIEEIISSFPGVADAAVTTKIDSHGKNRVHAVIVAQGGLDQKRLMEFCKSKCQEGFAPSTVTIVDSMPRNEMGKIDRGRLLHFVR